MSNIFITNIVGTNDFAIPTDDAELATATTELDALLATVANLAYTRVLAWVQDAGGPGGAEGVRSLNCLIEQFTYNAEECPSEAEVDTMTAAIESTLEADPDITSIGQQQVSIFQAGAYHLWSRDSGGGFLYPSTTTDDVAVGGAVAPKGKWFDDGDLVLGNDTMTGTEKLKVVGDVLVVVNASNEGNVGLPVGNLAGTQGAYEINGNHALRVYSTNLYIGNSAGTAGTQGRNVIVGEGAFGNNDINDSVMVGYNTGAALVTGEHAHTFIGSYAGETSTNSGNFDGSVFIGYQAGRNNNQSYTVAIGYQAAIDGSSGNHNVIIGYQAADDGSFASTQCVVIGSGAGNDLTSSVANTAVGYQSLDNLTTGDDCVAVGATAGRGLYGNENFAVAVGYGAMGQGSGTAGGRYCVAVGPYAHYSWYNSTATSYNTAIGPYALYNLSTGSSTYVYYTIGIGYYAGGLAYDASYCMYLGANAGYSNHNNYRLYIHSSSSDENEDVLIYGEFDNYYLEIKETMAVIADETVTAQTGVTAQFDRPAATFGDKIEYTGFHCDIDHNATYNGSSGATLFRGFYCDIDASTTYVSGETLDNAFGFVADISVSDTIVCTTYQGVFLNSPTGDSSITNSYGIQIEDQNLGSTTVYGVYIKAQTNGLSLHSEEGMECTGQAASPYGVAADKGGFWVKDGTPTTAWFTDSGGTDHQLATGGASPWTSPATVIYPATLSKTVAINSTAMLGGEKFYVLDDTETGTSGCIVARWDRDAATIMTDWVGVDVDVDYSGESGVSGDLIGYRLDVDYSASSSGTISTFRGGYYKVDISGTRTINNCYGLQVQVSESTGTITNAQGFYANVNAGIAYGMRLNSVQGTGSGADDAYGILVNDVDTTAGTGDAYGIYVNTVDSDGGSAYSLYCADAGANNYFAGQVGVGTTSLNYMLEVDAGELGLRSTITTASNETTIIAIESDIDTDHTVTNAYGLRADSPAGSGTISSIYGLYIDQQKTGPAAAATAYGVYQANSSDDNYFAGQVGVGTTSLNYQLEVEAVELALRSRVVTTTNETTIHAIRADLETDNTVTNAHNINVDSPSGSGTISTIYGLYIDQQRTGPAAAATAYGVYQTSSSDQNYFAGNTGVGIAASSSYALSVGNSDYGVRCDLDTGGSSPAVAPVFTAAIEVDSGDTISFGYGYRVMAPTGTGTITTNYGFYLQDLDGGSASIGTSYGIYQSGANDKNYFEGKTGFAGTPGSESARAIAYSTHTSGTEHGYEADWTSSATISTGTSYTGFLADVNLTGSGVVSGVEIKGYYVDFDINAATSLDYNIDKIICFEAELDIDADTHIDNLYGARIELDTDTGSVTNAYGVYIAAAHQSATNSWGIYQSPGAPATVKNYFGDDVGIGDSTPSYPLDVNGDVNVQTGSVYRHNGSAGLSGTYTFGGGSSGDIASMTFAGGILIGVTTVP